MTTLSYPHSCHINFRTYLVARFIHNYFESPNIAFRFRLQDRCSSKQSDWYDSQFQLSNDICACRQINWNRNKTTTTFVRQIAKQQKSKSKCNLILIYWIAFFQIFLQIFQIFFQLKTKKKPQAPIVSYDRECIQKL
jgi:hypothetical protein